MSKAYCELRQPAEVVRAIRAGVEQIGGAYELHDVLGSALLEAGENEAAVEALPEAVVSGPADAAVGYNLAIALIAVRKHARVEGNFSLRLRAFCASLWPCLS